MSDNDNIISFPGNGPVDPPCDTEGYNEPETIITLTTEFTKAIEDHRKARNHASDVNPSEGSTTFPYVYFITIADTEGNIRGKLVFQRGHTDREEYELTKHDVIKLAADMMTWVACKRN